MNQITKHIIVEGKVQGVFFRKNTRKKAEELNVFGWVKNTLDDKVEIVVQGSKENIDKFIEWCKQGPPRAHVKNVHVEEKETDESFKDFSIMYEDD